MFCQGMKVSLLMRDILTTISDIVIQGVRSQSSDQLCPTNIDNIIYYILYIYIQYMIYASRNRIVALM